MPQHLYFLKFQLVLYSATSWLYFLEMVLS